MVNNLPVIRHQQIKYIIAPLYEEAGLLIRTPTIRFSTFKEETSHEAYIVCKISGMRKVAYIRIEEIPFIGDPPSLYIIAIGSVKLIHSISIRSEIAKGFSKKNKYPFKKIYIHRDDRVEALKQALVHIVLMGDY